MIRKSRNRITSLKIKPATDVVRPGEAAASAVVKP
jgi:hypothetical protein